MRDPRRDPKSRIIEVLQAEDKSSLHVAAKSNVAGRKTEILSITPPTGIAYRVNILDFYVLLKLNKTGGGQITDRQAKLWLVAKRGDIETVEQFVEFDYLKWIDLSIVQQMNVNYRENTKIEFPGSTKLEGKVRVAPGDIFMIEMKSSDVVSWAAGDASYIHFKLIEENLFA